MSVAYSLSQRIINPKRLSTLSQTPVDMQRIATIILGGGQGSRLSPLTNTCCKPALCFGGRYHLIDIPMSNAINSGCQKIFIVTQFLATSLHQHISRTYRPGTFFPGFIELLTAEQKPQQETWYQGTADAIRQNLNHLTDIPAEYFLILSGDQLYNINFQHMVKFAKETNADLIIAAQPVRESEARRMGLLKVNEDHFITEFSEKPQERAILDRMRMPEFTTKQIGLTTDEQRHYLGSMGIYLFKRQVLFDLLTQDSRHDFGSHLIPTKVAGGGVAAYIYDGYWEDIGTVESFYHANIALTKPNPAFNCYDEVNPIFSFHQQLPAPRISRSEIHHSVICEGAIIEAREVTHSILGPRTVVKQGSVIRNSYLMGNEFYAHPIPNKRIEQLCIEEDCVIDQAIIDKNVRIGKGVHLVNHNKLKQYDGDGVYIRDGIIVVSKGTHIPDGFIL